MERKDAPTINEMIVANRKAWDRSEQEYVEYCKAYYINLMLSNRFQQLLEQRRELKTKMNQADPTASSLTDFLPHNKGTAKAGRGGARQTGPRQNMREAFLTNSSKQVGRNPMEKAAFGRDRTIGTIGGNKLAASDRQAATSAYDDDKRKRHRRTAEEIQRHYACPVEGCHKSYGSEGSMNQHMKLKHVEFYRQQIQCGNLQSGPGRVSSRYNVKQGVPGQSGTGGGFGGSRSSYQGLDKNAERNFYPDHEKRQSDSGAIEEQGDEDDSQFYEDGDDVPESEEQSSSAPQGINGDGDHPHGAY